MNVSYTVRRSFRQSSCSAACKSELRVVCIVAGFPWWGFKKEHLSDIAALSLVVFIAPLPVDKDAPGEGARLLPTSEYIEQGGLAAPCPIHTTHTHTHTHTQQDLEVDCLRSEIEGMGFGAPEAPMMASNCPGRTAPETWFRISFCARSSSGVGFFMQATEKHHPMMVRWLTQKEAKQRKRLMALRLGTQERPLGRKGIAYVFPCERDASAS